MERFSTAVSFYKISGDVLNPFEENISEDLVYSGYCDAVLISGRYATESLKSSRYALYIDDDTMPDIDERDIAILSIGDTKNLRCIVTDFMRYSRVSVIYCMIPKKGDVTVVG